MTERQPEARHIVIVAGGEESDQEFLRREMHGDFWCADRGYLLSRSVGLAPSLVIGDLDSLQHHHLHELEQAGAEILRYPPQKDESDLELALREAQNRGYSRVTFLGMTGGRLDHALFNLLAVLGLAHDIGVEAVALSSDSLVRLLGPGDHVFPAVPGSLCSLLPLTPTVEQVDLEGFRYLLRGEDLKSSSTRSLSNIVVADPIRIRFRQGRLLMLLPAHDPTSTR